MWFHIVTCFRFVIMICCCCVLIFCFSLHYELGCSNSELFLNTRWMHILCRFTFCFDSIVTHAFCISVLLLFFMWLHATFYFHCRYMLYRLIILLTTLFLRFLYVSLRSRFFVEFSLCYKIVCALALCHFIR